MKKFVYTVALIALLPAVSYAQERPRGGPQGRMLQSTIEWLLSQKDQFRPTEEQVAKLEELNKKLTESSANEREELRKIRDEAMNGGGDRREMREKVRPPDLTYPTYPTYRPLMEKLRKHDEEAAEDALELLNDEQQKVVKDLLETRKKEMEARRRPR
jgi:hypothetical protein